LKRSLRGHELKAPIIGANHVLTALVDKRLGDLNAEQIDILQQLIEGHTNTLGVIGGILEVYQFERDIDKLVLSTTNLIDIVNQCIAEGNEEAFRRISRSPHTFLRRYQKSLRTLKAFGAF